MRRHWRCNFGRMPHSYLTSSRAGLIGAGSLLIDESLNQSNSDYKAGQRRSHQLPAWPGYQSTDEHILSRVILLDFRQSVAAVRIGH